MRFFLVLLMSLVWSTANCTHEEPSEPLAAVVPLLVPLPPGDALPPHVDAMLYGSAKTCRTDAECPGRVCYYGACIGLLVVDQRWMQSNITERLVTTVEARTELRPRVLKHLNRVLTQPDTDLAFRARALLPLEGLKAVEHLQRALKDPDEKLQAAAAMALARLGHADGLPLTRALTEHREQAIAAEALRALGQSKQGDALVPLLRTLNANLDPSLLRAALNGLRNLGDRRAIRPLHAWLASAPEYLHHEILVTLRTLTGASLGRSADAWRLWIQDNNPDSPPEYTVRVHTADEELGLPTP